MRRMIIACLFMLVASGCYNVHTDPESPCNSKRYVALGAQTTMTKAERAEFDSLQLLCHEYIFQHRDDGGRNSGGTMATAIIVTLLVSVVVFIGSLLGGWH
jgi:hypothetical protein